VTLRSILPPNCIVFFDGPWVEASYKQLVDNMAAELGVPMRVMVMDQVGQAAAKALRVFDLATVVPIATGRSEVPRGTDVSRAPSVASRGRVRGRCTPDLTTSSSCSRNKVRGCEQPPGMRQSPLFVSRSFSCGVPQSGSTLRCAAS